MTNKEQVIQYLNTVYTEEAITNWLDQEILEWLDEDWNDNFESEYDWYGEYGSGEAESAIKSEIVERIKNRSGITIDSELDLYDIINELFPMLDK